MKTSLWIVLLVAVAWTSFLVGYSVSALTGASRQASAPAPTASGGYAGAAEGPKAEAGAYGAPAVGGRAKAGGYGAPSGDSERPRRARDSREERSDDE